MFFEKSKIQIKQNYNWNINNLIPLNHSPEEQTKSAISVSAHVDSFGLEEFLQLRDCFLRSCGLVAEVLLERLVLGLRHRGACFELRALFFERSQHLLVMAKLGLELLQIARAGSCGFWWLIICEKSLHLVFELLDLLLEGLNFCLQTISLCS